MRQVFNIVDGIVGGEGNGPLDPQAKAVGTILAVVNSVVVDLACARLIGFDYRAMPLLRRSLEDHPLPLCLCGYENIDATSAKPEFHRLLCMIEATFPAFRPHFGWRGHIEATNR